MLLIPMLIAPMFRACCLKTVYTNQDFPLKLAIVARRITVRLTIEAMEMLAQCAITCALNATLEATSLVFFIVAALP